MILLVTNVNENKYVLRDLRTRILYETEFKFVEIAEQIEERDLIKIHKDLLDNRSEMFSPVYYLGALDNISGRQIVSSKDKDLIKIKRKGKIIKFKRLYG